MRVVYEYSHLGGAEILKVHYPEIDAEIYDAISQVTARRLKQSREKTMMGRMFFSPKDLNAQFDAAFRARGFDELRDRYTIRIPDSVLIEVQFGKYAFMFYDMAKFQYFFNENKAQVGIEIVPAHALQREMSSGVSYGEQLVYDIERLKRHFPAVPVKIILIDSDNDDPDQESAP